MPDRASNTSLCVTPVSLECWWILPGTADQVRRARRLLTAALDDDCPVADDVILCLSELATNAIRHSVSGHPGGTFTVRAEICPGHSIVVEVRDQGGHWQHELRPDEQLHGLSIVAQLAGELRVDGDRDTGWAVSAWFPWTHREAEFN